MNLMRPEHPVLSSPKLMCALLAKASELKIPNTWYGGSHGYHPRGYLDQGVLMVNSWHTDHYCKISISEDPEAKWKDAIISPTAYHSSAEPKPIGCESITVWSSGSLWTKEGPWCDKINNMLYHIEDAVKVKREILAAQDLKEKEKQQLEKEQREKELIDKWAQPTIKSRDN